MITIQCDGGDVEAKKSLLVAVSDVFKAMLESDMLDKRTNHVLANDVNFETMKTVMDYYKEGTISGFEAMNRDAFTYVVEKYNFLGIKEEIAEYLLENYFIKQDVNILESIFFFYGDKCKKITVIKEIALIVTGGKKAPKFVAKFNGFEFTEFAKVCSAALIGSTFDRYHEFFKTLYKWASTKPEERSVAVLEIIGMIDMSLFSNENVQTLLKSLLEQRFILPPNPGFKMIFCFPSHKIPACDFSIFSEMNRASALTKILANFDKKESPLITIRCDGGDVEAQKPLLTAISDVFKAVLEPDRLEKPTNIVLANDVNYETMKTIIDYYKEGSVFGFETMNRDAFTYIVEKYKFLGIKEEIAEYLLLSNFIKQDVKFLENIFFTYGNKCKKITVIKEMALMTAEGKEAPQFVADFNAPDFLEFAKCCCDALTGRKFEGFHGFLNTLYNWLSKNSEERSVAVVEIIGMIDIRKFSRRNVQILLENLHLSPKFEGLKLMLLKSLDFTEKTHELLLSFTENSGLKKCRFGDLKCRVCDHDSNYPFHKGYDCSGIHSCKYLGTFSWCTLGKSHSGACGKHFSHPNKPFF